MTLTMQQWIFEESYDRYTIDLGDSFVETPDVSGLVDGEQLAGLSLGYGHQSGVPELRDRVAARYPGVRPEQVLIAHGAQEAFSLLVRARAEAVDAEALVVGSGWAQHTEFPRELGYVVRTVPLDGDETELLGAVADAITWRTAVVIVASPDNPTGWTASRPLLSGLAEIADAYDALLIVDEEYVVEPLRSVAGLSDAIAIVSGLSKVHGLPGLRIGWCVAAPEVIALCERRKHLTTISNSVLCETLATAVLGAEAGFVSRARDLCAAGYRQLTQWARETAWADVAGGGELLPFAWLRLAPGINSLDVARGALERGVLVVPGEVFDSPGYLRVAVARSAPVLDEGLAAIVAALDDETRAS